ncbi:MAG: hypothetical protein WCW02_00040 [Candidatus Buchananbacteria bacterium]
MSERVYLKPGILNEKTVTKTAHEDKFKIESGNGGQISIWNERNSAISQGKGWYTDIDPQKPVPEVLKKHISGLSIQDNFADNPPRTRGLYTLGGATGILDNSNKNEYSLTIQGEKVVEVRALYYYIRAGLGKNYLVINYDNPQS